MGKREANRLRLQIGEREHVARIVDERKGVGIAPCRALACGEPLRGGDLFDGKRRDLDAPALQMGRDLREFRRREKKAFGQDHGAVDRVLELPQVARPAVTGEQGPGLRRQASDPLALIDRETADETLRPISDRLRLR